MAKSAKPPAKSSYAGKTRKPKRIDHVEKTDITPEAEPIAMDKQPGKPQEKLMSDEQNEKTPRNDLNQTHAQEETKPFTASNAYKKDMPKTMDRQKEKKSGRSTSLWALGFLGGVVALALGAGLQWAGIIPSFSNDLTWQTRLTNVSDELGDLKRQLADHLPMSVQQLSVSDRQALDDAFAAASAIREQTDEMERQLAAITANVETFKTSMSSGNNDQSQIEAMKTLSLKIDDLSKKTTEALSLSNHNSETIQVIHKKIDNLESQITHGMQGKDIAVMMAVNALKNAVDRGGSYHHELQTLQNLAPQLIVYDALEKKAQTGIASQVTLANMFSHVADAIAATQNQVPLNAGFGEKLWASVKGLVSLRPVGDTLGTDAGAIAARMEVAIQKGDYQKAFAEWENLPQNAKDISAEFMQTLQAKRDIDALLTHIIALSLQSDPAQSDTAQSEAVQD
ncbi:hypothetical protein [Bartonella tamiae]|uniref:Uncharacterized protein n=1 Tax=Bartonella tamiae Th239 TaxID=1094558 RepID=J1K353_9HYPH|nr:hypothetical protein [Bartonella tamiae]EJF91545.1 hypothetical protein ME5_00240 [Bartonella tamiae Th239]EJF92471.1 hypothetical protein MEG_01641 [Bartonella tamiae Th307]